MNFRLDYVDYVDALRGYENQPASFKYLLSPFGILDAPAQEDEFLLIGHVLDAMLEAGYDRDHFGPECVMELAFELGMSTVA